MNYKRFIKRTEYDTEKRNKADNFEFLNESYCAMGQTVLAGDSITELFNYTELFREYSAESKTEVYNRGISGDTSDRLLERLEKTVLNLKPENLVLLIGVNDLNAGADADYVLHNTEKIISLAQERLPEINIVLQAVYPVSKKYARKIKSKITALNAGLKTLAEGKEIGFVDLTDMLSDENGFFNSSLTYDGLHPNARAFAAAAQRIIPLLKK